MKTILLFSLLLIMSVTASAQDTLVYNPTIVTEPSYITGEYIPYIIGSHSIPGYDLEIRSCSVEGTTLSNGRRIAGLSCIISEEDTYIGGQLIFNGDTTTIKSLEALPKGAEGAEFVVTGKDFTMRFDLSNGTILKLEDNFTTFNTNGKGIWKIVKKS